MHRGRKWGGDRGNAPSGYRKKNGDEAAGDNDTSSQISSEVGAAFSEYSLLLDDHHDRHERLVKLSRDVTIESKRTIFMLHRIIGNSQPDKIVKDAESKLEHVRVALWKQIAIEIDGRDPYRYLRAISPGMQEYVEAVTFLHYIQYQKLASWSDVCSQLAFEIPLKSTEEISVAVSNDAAAVAVTGSVIEKVCVELPWTEYILGVADLSGELMRYCISCVGQGEINLATNACRFVREMHDAFVSLGQGSSTSSKDIGRKVWTLKQSLHKMETACYALQIRGSEVPKSLLAMACSMEPYDRNRSTELEDYC